MTSAIDIIGWLEVGEAGRAAALLPNASSDHMHPPFAVWTESDAADQHQSLVDEGCYHFMTGAGGFVQAMVNGYGGVRVQQQQRQPLNEAVPVLSFNMTAPPGAMGLTLRSVSFQGARLSAALSLVAHNGNDSSSSSSTSVCLVEAAPATAPAAAGFAVSWQTGGTAPPQHLAKPGDCSTGVGRAQVFVVAAAASPSQRARRKTAEMPAPPFSGSDVVGGK
jgi:hypothetical protein